MTMSLKGGSHLQLFLVALVYVTALSTAHATMTCTWLDEFAATSDPSVQQRLEAYVKALPGLKNYEIRPLQDHYFLVGAEGKLQRDPTLRTSSSRAAGWSGQDCLCL